jgi:hypothetical protein
MIRVVYPESGSWDKKGTGSRIRKTGIFTANCSPGRTCVASPMKQDQTRSSTRFSTASEMSTPRRTASSRSGNSLIPTVLVIATRGGSGYDAELDLQSLFGLHVTCSRHWFTSCAQLFSLAETPHRPPSLPLQLGSYPRGALLVRKDR